MAFKRPIPRRLRRALAVAGWAAVLAVAAALAFAYALPQDFTGSSKPHLAPAAVAFWVRTLQFQIALLGLPILCGALLLRRRRLAAATGAVALAALLPALRSLAPVRPPAPAGPTVRVMAYNVFGSNRDAAAMVASVRAVDTDVLAVEECYPPQRRALSAALGDYPYRWSDAEKPGQAIYSKVPFEQSPPTAGAGVGYWNRKRVVLEVGGRRVALHTVHLMPPMSLHAIGIGRREVAALLEDLAGETLPVIVAGDFNFAETTPNCAALEGAGLARCRALAGGSGRSATWPADGWRGALPVVRIDHVFVSKELTCTAAGTGAAGGSDHRPVWADVGISQ